MDFNQVKELIEIVNSSELRSFEISLDGAFVKMSKNEAESVQTSTVQPITSVQETVVTATKETMEVKKEEEKTEKEITGNLIKAPIVGTFYGSPSPDKPNFVSVGDMVKKGDVVCIIEAMKVMNEVVSEFDGQVKAVHVSEETLVEFGQVLFTIG